MANGPARAGGYAFVAAHRHGQAASYAPSEHAARLANGPAGASGYAFEAAHRHGQAASYAPTEQADRLANGPAGAGGYARFHARFRRVGPVGGALLVLAAHAVHLLALPLLAAWIGLNAAATTDSGSSPLAGHTGHAGHAGSGSLPMRWAADLLAAATVAAAISMCGAMARSWRNVRSHPLPCILYTLVALLCIGMIVI